MRGRQKERQESELNGSSYISEGGYILVWESICEEWDKLVQNPFLAFYQRWPWFAHYTPLLNLWNHATT